MMWPLPSWLDLLPPRPPAVLLGALVLVVVTVAVWVAVVP